LVEKITFNLNGNVPDATILGRNISSLTDNGAVMLATVFV
jgi:hypothetical protein